MQSRLLFFLCVSSVFFLTSCESNNEEDLYPCQPTTVTYSNTIAPIIEQNCFACHGGTGVSTSGIPLDSYEGLKAMVDGQRLIGAIRRLNGFSPMPQGSNALPECEILKIERWVTEGALNN